MKIRFIRRPWVNPNPFDLDLNVEHDKFGKNADKSVLLQMEKWAESKKKTREPWGKLTLPSGFFTSKFHGTKGNLQDPTFCGKAI